MAGKKPQIKKAATEAVLEQKAVKAVVIGKKPRKKVGKQGNGGGRKRGRANTEEDRLEVIELYLAGKNYRQIADIISSKRNYSISCMTVGNDVKFMLEEWKKTREDKVELYITIELAKIDKLEREYWESWEKSKKNHEQKAAKIVKRGENMSEETSVRHFTEFGDPRFLQGVERCIQKRIDLLGLEAAKTINIKDVSETTVWRVKKKTLDNVDMRAVS